MDGFEQFAFTDVTKLPNTYGGIYLVEVDNVIVYVGKTIQPFKLRWSSHQHKKLLQSLKNREVLIHCRKVQDLEELYFLELKLIAEYKPFLNGGKQRTREQTRDILELHLIHGEKFNLAWDDFKTRYPCANKFTKIPEILYAEFLSLLEKPAALEKENPDPVVDIRVVMKNKNLFGEVALSETNMLETLKRDFTAFENSSNPKVKILVEAFKLLESYTSFESDQANPIDNAVADLWHGLSWFKSEEPLE